MVRIEIKATTKSLAGSYLLYAYCKGANSRCNTNPIKQFVLDIEGKARLIISIVSFLNIRAEQLLQFVTKICRVASICARMRFVTCDGFVSHPGVL